MTMVTDQKQEGNTCTEKKTTGKDNQWKWNKKTQ